MQINVLKMEEAGDWGWAYLAGTAALCAGRLLAMMADFAAEMVGGRLAFGEDHGGVNVRDGDFESFGVDDLVGRGGGGVGVGVVLVGVHLSWSVSVAKVN